jgi:signal transduction histidine kinase
MHQLRAETYGGDSLFDVINAAGVALGVIDPEGTLTLANYGWCGGDRERHVPWALQVEPGSNCTQALRDYAQQGDESAKRVLQAFERVGSGVVRTIRCEFFEAEPEFRWFDITINSLGPNRGLIVSSIDVTARKRAAAATANQVNELARSTRTTTMSLLAASTAHELSQPLFAIRVTAEATLRQLNTIGADEDVRESVSAIAGAARRATDIIQHMRKLLSGGTPDRALLDVNQLAREVVRMTGDDARQRQVRIDTALDPRRPIVLGDSIQLQQMLTNLIVNAIDVTVGNIPEERNIHVTTTANGATVEICVKDHGPPLDANALQRIFDPLYTTKRSGMGLGLYITRAIVESHGGLINARRLSDHGLSMQVTLPAAPQHQLEQLLQSVT